MCKLQSALKILPLPLVIDGELLASVHTVALIFHQLVPQSRRLLMLAAALREECQLAARLPVVFLGQTEIDSLRAGRVCPLRIAAPLQKTPKTEQVQPLPLDYVVDCQQRVDLADQRGQPA